MGQNLCTVDVPKLLNDINECHFNMVWNASRYIRREDFSLKVPTKILFAIMHHLDQTNSMTLMQELSNEPQTLFGFQLVEDHEGSEVRLTATKGDLVLGSERIDV